MKVADHLIPTKSAQIPLLKSALAKLFFSRVFLVGVVVYGIAAGGISLVTDPDQRANITNLLVMFYNFLAALSLLWAAWRLRQVSRIYASAWLILAFSQLAWFLGDTSYAIRESLMGELAYLPSIADFFYLIYYPLFLIAIFRFPSHSRTRIESLKAFLQVAIVMMAAFLILWNFVIGPIIQQADSGDPLMLWITMAYPLGDMLLFLSVLLIIFRRRESSWVEPIYLVVMSVSVTIIADVIYSYEAIQGIYATGNLADFLYLASYVLMGCAGWLQVRRAGRETSEFIPARTKSRLASLITYTPYLWVAAAFIFLISSVDGTYPMRFSRVAAWVGVIIVMVIVLQSLALTENSWLADRLSRANEVLEARVQARTAQLSDTIEQLESEAKERLRYAAELQTSRELYRAVVEDLPVLICRYRKDGVLTFVNEAYCRYFERTLEQLVGSSFYDLIPEGDHQYVKDKIRGLSENQPIAVMDHRVYTDNGAIRWQRWTDRAVFNQGTLIEFQSIGEDITEQKLAEEALRASEEKFRDLFDNSSDLIQIIAPDGRFLFVNRAWREALGYSEERLLTLTMWDILSASCRVQCKRHLEDVLQGKNLRNLKLEFQTEHGNILYVEGNINCAVEDGRPLYIRGIFRDISERIQHEEQLQRQAYTDDLTGLPNRACFIDRLHETIQLGQRRQGTNFALYFLDLDNFKVVNDSQGHQFGDQLLIAIASRLRSHLREDDMVSRLGGDEFVILCRRLSEEVSALHLAERLLADLRRPIVLQSNEIVITASMGVVIGNSEVDVDSLMRDADIALYRAKSMGKNQAALFEESLRETSRRRMQLEGDLRLALERQEFRIHYQPVYELPSRRVTGFEALLRWQHPARGLLMPVDFLDVAEENGLMVSLSHWILRQACYQLAIWQLYFPGAADMIMSVNLSARQLADPNLQDMIRKTLSEYKLSSGNLALEITETLLMDNIDLVSQRLKTLHDIGVHIYIDDFGTGYSSLERLQRLPVDTIKIDRSFLQNPDMNGENGSILRAIAVIGQELGMDLIVEGVEHETQVQSLLQLGLCNMQGYLFAHPASPDSIADLLT